MSFGRARLTRPAMFGVVAAVLLLSLGAVNSQGARGGDEGGSAPALPPSATGPA